MRKNLFLAAAYAAAAFMAAPAFAASTTPASKIGDASYLADPDFPKVFGPYAASVLTATPDVLTGVSDSSNVSTIVARKCFYDLKPKSDDPADIPDKYPTGYSSGAGMPFDVMFTNIVDSTIKHILLEGVMVPSTMNSGCAVVWFFYTSNGPAAPK